MKLNKDQSCKGKTIKKITYCDVYQCLHFTDDTYSLFKLSYTYDSDPYFEYCLNQPDDGRMFDLELITKSEYNKRMKAAEKKWTEKKANEEYELFKRLKEKYEGKKK